MCLILFAWQVHPDYPLVLAANRDEFLDRPTAAADYWHDTPYILAGKDLKRGGTWLGITRQGRFAAITNYREPTEYNTSASSRGRLVSEFLLGSSSLLPYAKSVHEIRHDYNPFNFLVGNTKNLYFYGSVSGNLLRLSSGIYGLSNGELDTPWPKVTKGKGELMRVLSNNQEFEHEDLFTILADDTQADDDTLPDTGVGLEWERILSPLFINSDNYGTRSSTVLTIDRNNNVHFSERGFNANKYVTTQFSFRISKDGMVDRNTNQATIFA